MIAYKVLRKHNSKLYSAVILNSKYTIEYKKNRWIKPKIGKIFCFAALEDAERFIVDTDEVWEVKIEIENPIKVNYILDTYQITDTEITMFWQKNIDGTHRLPEGTILADKIKLLRRVV